MIKEYKGWNTPPVRGKIAPERQFFIICEGQHTERVYFQSLIAQRKQLALPIGTKLYYVKKIGNERGISDPRTLIHFAQEKKAELKNFQESMDKMVVVFDADVFQSGEKPYSFQVAYQLAQSYGFLLAVTNPSFELFLLLHKENSFLSLLQEQEADIVRNDWLPTRQGGRKRYIYELFCREMGFDSKASQKVGALALDIHQAIAQEKMLNQNIQAFQGKLTSNVGQVIETMFVKEK